MDLSMYESILTAALGVAVVIIGFSLKRNVKDQDARLQEHAQFTKEEFDRTREKFGVLEVRILQIESSIKSITGNYLDRFADLKDHVNKQGMVTLDRINDNRIVNVKEHSDILSAISELKTMARK
jgi:hypothetical protein